MCLWIWALGLLLMQRCLKADLHAWRPAEISPHYDTADDETLKMTKNLNREALNLRDWLSCFSCFLCKASRTSRSEKRGKRKYLTGWLLLHCKQQRALWSLWRAAWRPSWSLRWSARSDWPAARSGGGGKREKMKVTSSSTSCEDDISHGGKHLPSSLGSRQSCLYITFTH